MKELRELEASAPTPTLAVVLANDVKGSRNLEKLLWLFAIFKEVKHLKDAPCPLGLGRGLSISLGLGLNLQSLKSSKNSSHLKILNVRELRGCKIRE